MRALVTGGCGFIGRRVVRMLLREGLKVDVVDDLSTGSSDVLHELRAEGANAAIGCVAEYPARAIYDEIWHLASPASPDVFVSRWDAIVRANVVGLSRILQLCADERTRLFVASSSEIYGRSKSFSLQDKGVVDSLSVRGIYDESKRLSESIAANWWRARNQRSTAVLMRFFNTYGDDMPDDGRVINTFVRQARAGEALTVHGSGAQSRSFCHIDDLTRQIHALRAAVTSPTLLPVNLGTDQEITITQLAQLVAQTADRVFLPLPLIRNVPGREDDPYWRRPDLSATTVRLGADVMTPTVTLSDGIERALRC